MRAFLLVVVCFVAGCNGKASCVENATFACACMGGATGVQACTSQGTVGACICPDAAAAGVGAAPSSTSSAAPPKEEPLTSIHGTVLEKGDDGLRMRECACSDKRKVLGLDKVIATCHVKNVGNKPQPVRLTAAYVSDNFPAHQDVADVTVPGWDDSTIRVELDRVDLGRSQHGHCEFEVTRPDGTKVQ